MKDAGERETDELAWTDHEFMNHDHVWPSGFLV